MHNNLLVYEKSKIVSFAYSMIKKKIQKNNSLSLPSRFPVKLISCIVFGSATNVCYLLKSIAIIL